MKNLRSATASLVTGVALAMLAMPQGSNAQAVNAVPLATAPAPVIDASQAVATFAGGCFWCVESDFESVPGVQEVVSGYTGDESKANPTYRDHGRHLEAAQVFYDPTQVSYRQLVEAFFRSIDPTDAGGQFCDRGNAYTTAVFANNDEQRRIAAEVKADIEKSGVLGKPVVTPIRDAGTFTNAEGYHQNYYKENPVRYKYYRYSCGRNERVKSLWGDQAYSGIPAH